MATETEIAWAAGLFEGEGSIMCTADGGAKLSIAMTDRDVIERFAEVMEFRRVHIQRKTNPRHKTSWRAGVTALRAEAALDLMLPFFGERRRTKALEALVRLAIKYPLVRCPECDTIFRTRYNQVFCSARCRNNENQKLYYRRQKAL